MASDEAPQRPPRAWVSGFIILACIAVYALQIELRATHGGNDVISGLGPLFAPSVRDRQWWRLLTYAFLHGGAVHLGFNMFATVALGIPLERRIGSARFLPLSLAACLGSAAVITLVPRGQTVPVVGVSGVIFGWAGALLFLVSRAQLRQLGQMLLVNALISVMPGVSWQGHLGGFLAGVVCGFLLRLDPQRFSSRVPFVVGIAGFLSIWGAYR
jgi:membrane associated rhomboid family serine protease